MYLFFIGGSGSVSANNDDFSSSLLRGKQLFIYNNPTNRIADLTQLITDGNLDTSYSVGGTRHVRYDFYSSASIASIYLKANKNMIVEFYDTNDNLIKSLPVVNPTDGILIEMDTAISGVGYLKLRTSGETIAVSEFDVYGNLLDYDLVPVLSGLACYNYVPGRNCAGSLGIRFYSDSDFSTSWNMRNYEPGEIGSSTAIFFDEPKEIIGYRIRFSSLYNQETRFPGIALFLDDGTRIDLSQPTNRDFTEMMNIDIPEGKKVSSVHVYIKRTTDEISLSELQMYALELPSDETPPQIPKNPTAIAYNGYVDLAWDKVTDVDLAGYNVYLNGEKFNDSLITEEYYRASPVSSDENHNWRISAVDLSGNESQKSEVVTTYFDTVSPVAPVGLVSSPIGDGSTLLTWQKNDEPDLDGYNAYQNNVQINEWLITNNRYQVHNLQDNVVYKFAVTALDVTGNESEKSEEVTYYNDATTPLTPDNVVADILPSGKVIARWQHNADGKEIDGFHVYLDGRRVNANLVVGNEFELKGLFYSQEYRLTIVAVDSFGNESGHSFPVSFIAPEYTDLEPPEPPIGLTASIGNSYIGLSWSRSPEPDLDGYNVYRVDLADNSTNDLYTTVFYTTYVNSTKINSTLIRSNSYSVTGLDNDTDYTFYVTAVDKAGNESSPSESITAAPSDKGLPNITLGYTLVDLAKSIGAWFASVWYILAFVIAIPLAFYIANQVRQLFY